ncbi:translation initiation factor IF-2 [Candidatus Paracaedibacter symbiosus]|uniref:translation initiation factor IF-2 n=1 Tax=Candidatus Paracaedibacter symbiosus TaxID=244582 RepID=UPI0005099BBD|nr:translation initiation factor IF-2 [Candidatus Paracaedibacter symbiosus]
MTEESKQTEKKTLTLSLKPDAKKSSDSEQVRQSFSHGRSKTVAVEVKRKRVHPGDSRSQGGAGSKGQSGRLTEGELGARMRALQEAMKNQSQNATEQEEAIRRAEETRKKLEEERIRVFGEERLAQEEKDKQVAREKEKQVAPAPKQSKPEPRAPQQAAPQIELPPAKETSESHRPSQKQHPRPIDEDDEEEAGKKRAAAKVVEAKKLVPTSPRRDGEAPRKLNRNVISRALSGDEERSRSMAALKRARQKQKYAGQAAADTIKIVREVIIPEFITVGELANRMAIRSGDVVKSLMKLGMMVTINQSIDADTAELICTEFGHTPKRVSEADVETGLKGIEDKTTDLLPRAPVVTVMGHVDHGKTSLLDALRKTNVVSGEAGGITQHIGAYQVQLPQGKKITFIDTPGHAAFTEMRARGANVTDIVILVVAADDGIMEQTKEAINHAKAAGVPIIVAVNKIDKPDANPERVRSELLNSGIVTEEFGGDVMCVEVSAKMGLNLDKLEEAILLQAEVLELQANPNRSAEGVVVEAKVDRGRGTVATILIQRGTLQVGDIFVAGTEMGRVRALINDQGHKIDIATPAMPVEILGFNGVPSAGDEFFVVETEARAREVAEFRSRRERDARAVASVRSSMEQMMSRIAAGEAKELGVVIKTDVQGSLEAIAQSLGKLSTEEVGVRVLHAAVGGINESDIVLARASGGVVIGFNVRANPQARDLARRDGVDIRYYSIIYDVIDDIKAAMSGLLSPTLRERYLGSAEIREVFINSKVGKVAGCYITEGMVRRGAKVRLLRDNVVIHEGTLKTLRRFKDEVREVKESYECGMAFENYNDIRQGDIIECFEIESVARQL